jgi:hypothetical protein
MMKTVRYSLDTIRDEARQLVEKGILDRQQRIYALCEYIPVSEWLEVERELELNEFLLRDPLIDLLAQEEWEDD